jgi:hypothetical protein
MTISQTAAANAAYGNKVTTLANLPLAANTTTPVPASVATYYATNLAQGSGPSGTFLLTDFFGSAAGIPYNTDLTTVTSIISAQLAAGALTTLNTIYSYMKTLVSTNTYGVPPTITLPAPYNVPIYTTYDAALARLITEANAAIGTAVTAMGTATATLNATWYGMVSHSANESVNQAKASINYATLTAGAQLPITAFIPSLGDLGKQTQQGMAAQFLESIANTANQYGQAMVGALREGRNTSGLNSIGLTPTNGVPSQSANALPQATLISST